MTLPSVTLRIVRAGQEYVATAEQLVRMARAVAEVLRILGGRVEQVRSATNEH